MTPTPEDMARDLQADLATCDAAPPGPWCDAGGVDGQKYVEPPNWRRMPILYSYSPPDHPGLAFACAARDGWRSAIVRALAAEAELARLKADLVARLCCFLASYEMDAPHSLEAVPFYPDITPEKLQAMLDLPCCVDSCPHCFAVEVKFLAEWLAARLEGKP